MLSRPRGQGQAWENRPLHAAAPARCVPHPSPAWPTQAPHPTGARRALLRLRGWRQGLLVWDWAATCCPQPQPHNGALVSGRAGVRAELPGPPRVQSSVVWGGCPDWAARSRTGCSTHLGPQWCWPCAPGLCRSCASTHRGGGLSCLSVPCPGPLPQASGAAGS